MATADAAPARPSAPVRRPVVAGLPHPRPGLRARITLAFTLSAAVLSTLLAGTTWALARENILNQRELGHPPSVPQRRGGLGPPRRGRRRGHGPA
ncbi:MAG: hypothetical protein R2711_16540 [Acidimicrobiales bacterium]